MNTVHTTSEERPSTPTYTKLGRIHESASLSPLDGASSPTKGPITSSSERRKLLSSHDARASTAFPSTYVAGDFSNPFIDFNSFSVQLPYVGLRVDVLKHWIKGNKRQPLRYVCRLRPKEGEDDVIFFVVLFELVGDGVVSHTIGMEAGKEGNGYKSDTGSTKSSGSNDDGDNLGVD
jgi:Protein of unknown function (DUF1769)